MYFCPSCGNFADWLNPITGWCSACSPDEHSQLEAFLERNADFIEHYLLQGYPIEKALGMVRDTIRPTCIVCGSQINRASIGAVFCRAKVGCRRWQRRYKYLYQEHNLTKAEALAQILEELDGGI